jgi:monoamine oxidase
MYRIAGGSDRLVGALVAATPARLLLGHCLRAAADTGDRALARVEDAAGRLQEIEADAIVLALPVPALCRVELEPRPCEAQQRAWRALRYGRATKVLLQSGRDLFAGRRARAYATDTELGAFWDAGDGRLVAFLAGGAASARLRARVDREGGRIVDDLCWLGMAGAPEIALRAATWEDDPWAGGGYACVDAAFDPAWLPLLARRAGRLVFAGEHTSRRWQGYMNGAVESGLRAAAELMDGPSG